MVCMCMYVRCAVGARWCGGVCVCVRCEVRGRCEVVYVYVCV